MATTLGPTALITSGGVYTTSTVQQAQLGDKAYSADGRTFRYVLAGAVALVPGNVIQSPATVANHVNLTPTALPSLGDTTMTVTLGATAATANQYAGGTVVVEKGTLGVGQTFLIASHPAALSGATLVLTLSDAVAVTITGTVTVSLTANMYNGVIQAPITTLTGTPVGVAVAAIPALNYGWICSRGITGVKSDGAITVGTVAIAVPSAAAGAAKVMAATLFPIGQVCKTSIDTQVTPCFITID